jgi:U32 family peptidase
LNGKEVFNTEILTPISHSREIIPLVEAGASEIYCGYLSEEWIKAFNINHSPGNIDYVQISINKRDGIHANVTDLEELQEIVRISRQYDTEVFLALNANYYPQEAYELMRNYLKEIISAGIKHVIVSDIGLMSLISLEYPQLKITVSCLNQVLNTLTVDFYKQFNMERIVFPRHIAIDELIEVVENHPQVDFECFITSGKCIYDDGNCRCMHELGSICIDQWHLEYFNLSGDEFSKEEIKGISQNEHQFLRWSRPNLPSVDANNPWCHVGCSLCSIFHLVKLPNFKSLKIVGREKSVEYKAKQVRLTRQIIELAAQGAQFEEVKEYIAKTFGDPDLCKGNIRCIMHG